MSTTCNCDKGKHSECDGYVAPLVYSDTRPCDCACHETSGRNFQRGLLRAERSYHASNGQRDAATVTMDAVFTVLP